MRGSIYISFLTLCAVALGFCTKDYDVESHDFRDGIVEFGVSGITPSRLTDVDTWEVDDEVGIFMFKSEDGSTLKRNVRYGVDEGVGTSFATFTADKGSEIVYPESIAVDFLCYYPYTSSDITGTKILAHAATDMLVAKQENMTKSGGNVVNFGFDHVMAKVSIAITASDEVVDLGGLDVVGVMAKSVYASANYDLVKGVYSLADGSQEKHISFTVEVADDGESATATAILLPYNYDTTVEFTVGEKSYEAAFVTTLESGKCSRFKAVLGSDGVDFSLDNVDEWGDGASGDLGTTLEFDNWVDVAAEEFDWGDGSESNPWRISNSYQLAKLAADVRDGESYEGRYFELTDDIDLTGAEWTAIGTEECSFQGLFYGKNYWIKGMTITESGCNGGGLFGYADGATIDKVGVVECEIDANYLNIGGLAGYITGSTINNCFVTGAIVGGPNHVGGLVGYSEDSNISESYTSATLSGNNVSFYVGGVVGYMSGGMLFHSNNSAEVKGCSFVGGVVGCCDGAKVVVCYNSGEVSVVNNAQGAENFGGVVGAVMSGSVVASYNTAAVDSSATASVRGGLIGSLDGDVVATSCYNLGLELFGGEYLDQIACYYVGETGGAGTALATIAELNKEGVIEQMNNQIELWNLYDERKILYYYVAGADGDTPPSFAGGSTDIAGVEDWSLMAAPRFASGSGAENDPYVISNGYELAKLAVDVRDGQSYEDKYFRVSESIDLMGGEWTPIGNLSYHFKGNFDGENHTVSNYKISGENSCVGLFGYVSSSVIENVVVADANISGWSEVGGLVGHAAVNSKISSCHSDVTLYGSGDLVGGLVGSMYDSVVENCSSAGAVSGNASGAYYVGGLVGYACDSDDVDDTEIVNSFNTATVNDGTYTGGVLGGATDVDGVMHYRGVSIFGCYNSGTITSTAGHESYVGGVAGRFYDSEMVACYNLGEVNATGFAGGLIGCVHINATTSRKSNFFGSYNKGAVSGTVSSDALFGHSDIDGVNMVHDCFYIDGTQTKGYGESCTDLNDKVSYLNNAIAYWNYNTVRKYTYIYSSGSTPEITEGEAEFHFDRWSDVASLAFGGGSGVDGDPYKISDGYQLAKLASDAAAGESHVGKYFVITENIDLKGIEWRPIGNSAHIFSGYIDGDDKIVSNLKISGSNSYVGLFGNISGATVENLTLSGADVSGSDIVGAMFGQASENSTIANCEVEGVEVYGSRDLVGGLVGSISDSVVDGCSSAGEVRGNSGGSYYVGGLVGYACDLDDVDDTEIVNGFNLATVIDGTYTGGVLGGATDSDSYNHFRGVTLFGCHNSGTVNSATTHTSYAGGVAGRFYDSQMLACYNGGEVNATGYAGGLIGCVHVNATTTRISNFFGCYNIGKVTGTILSDALLGRSDIAGVNTVLDCYYVGGSQTNNYGSSCADISALNANVEYLNNSIAYWNQNLLRQYNYIYVEGADGPTLTEGSGEMHFDAWADVPALLFEGGSGDEGDPYQINDGYQLAKLAKDVKGGNTYEGKYFKITDDIDLASKLWSPIGRDGYIFMGTVDGGSHTISNLRVAETGGSVGLFGYIANASIFDLAVSGYDVKGSICVGALVGRADLSYIIDCDATGSESTLSGTSDYVGGLIGYNVDTSVANCSTEGTISGTSYVGGVIGYAYQRSGEDDIEIFNCVNNATVKDGIYIGGVLGGAADDDVATYKRGISIYCSHNNGTIETGESGSRYAGGIAGRFHDGQMVACYNWGEVTNTSGYAGGLIGCVHVNVSTKRSGFYGCYNVGEISGSLSSEALFGTSSSIEMAKDCYYLSTATDSSGLGVAAASTSVLNEAATLTYLNNAIATWNVISVRDLNFLYTSGSNAPTLSSGAPELIADYWVDLAAESFAGGSGASSSPYQIATREQLAKLSKSVAEGESYDGVCFEITANIDLMGKQWSAIGSSSHLFKGSVDGGNHTISNVSIYCSDSNQGLFGYVDGSTIENLKVTGILYGSTSLGGLVGRASGNSVIRNCHADVTVFGTDDLVGGLVGYISDSVVDSCSSAGTVTCTSPNSYYYGGLVGYACDSDDIDDTEIVNSHNSASVIDGTYTGGVIGGATDSDMYSHYRGVSIFGCYNTGEVRTSKTAAYAGGVAGRFYDSQMVACYNTGSVTSSDHAGGLIGCVHVNATTSRMSNFFGCYNTGAVSGTISSDALFGRSDIEGVNGVKNCYYVGGTQTNGYGESCSDINSQVDLMNNAIAFWNMNSDRKYNYLYVAGSTPSLTAGTAELDFDEWSDMAWVVFDGGSGAVGDPYQIANGCQLAKLSNDVNGGESYEGKYFELTASIDLLGREWSPIGSYSDSFKGKLDGGNYTISNLKITSTSGYVGLFGHISGSRVESLNISGGEVSGKECVGGVVGMADVNSTIINCHVDLAVTGSSDMVGGLVGSMYDSVVDSCSSTGAVNGNSSGWYYVGGLVGYACDSDDIDDTEIVNSYNTASVDGGTYTGGVLGGATDVDGVTHNRGVSLFGCHNSGIITSSSSHDCYAGGVVGRLYDSEMVACYNSGSVNATGYAGGLNGCVHVGATTSRMSNFFGSYNTGAVSGTISSNALFGHSDVSGINKVLDCFYTTGSQSNGYGEKSADLAVRIADLNNAIAFWNYNSVREYNYIFSYGSVPTLVAGDAKFNFDDWSDVAALRFGGGSGSDGDPYQINDGFQLAKLAADVEAGESYEGKFFVITDNIDLERASWSPIGRDGYIFKGSVDGDNHTISNLYIDEEPNPVTGGDGSVGLFGYVNGGVYQNITLSDYVVQGTICVGGLFGRADFSLINNCHVSGLLNATKEYGGGMAGYIVDSSVANSSSDGDVSGALYVGGLIGYAYQRSGVDDVEIFNCSNSSTVALGTYVGGILGGAADDDVATYKRGISIYCSYNDGDITTVGSGSKYAGGIAGRFHDGVMVACYNRGSVTNGCSTGYAGGLIGCVHPNATSKTSSFFGCYNQGAITGATSSEALFGMTHSLGDVLDCYYKSNEHDSSGKGVAESGSLNNDIKSLNNAISFWNDNSERYLGYIYTEGDNGPVITTGTPEVYVDNWYKVAAKSYAGGSGTEGDPYLIANGYQLAKIAVDYEYSNPTKPTYFKLIKDIDISGGEWTPVRSSDDALRYINLDGDNHAILGLKIFDDYEYLGLFGHISYSEIKDLRLVDCSIDSTSIYIGGLVGYLSYSSLYNCSVESGEIKGDRYIGGIVGKGYENDAIEHCSNQGASIIGLEYVGGVAGYLYGDGLSYLYACCNNGSLSMNNSIEGDSFNYFGGVVGYSYRSHIIACYNTGDVDVPNLDYIAGVAGRLSEGDMTSCYNSGKVTGDRTGGLVASLGSGSVSHSYTLSGDYNYNYGTTCSSYSALNGYVGSMNGYMPDRSYRTYYEYVVGSNSTTQPPTLVEK